MKLATVPIAPQSRSLQVGAAPVGSSSAPAQVFSVQLFRSDISTSYLYLFIF